MCCWSGPRSSTRCPLRLDEARGGLGTTVLVGGEAGSGKSSLAEHFVATVACRVLRSGCDGATTAAPLGPLMDVAPALKVDVPTHAGEPVDRLHLFAAVRSALVSELTVWLVEDLHWADAATLELIRYLARRGEDSPALLLLTFRDDEVGTNHPVRVLLGELATVRRVRRVDMRPLSRDAVAELARGSHVDLDALCERTGGNAFYVTEVLAGEDGVVPHTVRDAVLARAARLSPAAQDVLAAAAVIGFHVEIEVLATVSDQPLDALDDCLAAGVLRDGGTEVVFRHELAREAVAASLLPGRRRALHRAAYHALRALGAGRRPAARPPRRQRGRRTERDRPRAAGGDARRRAGRPPGGGRALPRRPALGPPHGRGRPRRPVGAAVLRVLPHRSSCRRRARPAAPSSRCAARNGDPLRTGAALRGLSRVAWYRLRNADAERYAQEAVDTLEQLPAGTELAMAYSNMAQLRMLADDPDGTQEWGDRAVELARGLGDLDTEIHALNNVGTALMIAGDPRGAPSCSRTSTPPSPTACRNTWPGRTPTSARPTSSTAATRWGRRCCKRASPSAPTATSSRGPPTCAAPARSSFWRPDAGRRRARSQPPSPRTRWPASAASTRSSRLGRLGTRTGADPAAAEEAWEAAEPSGEGQRVLICASGMAEAAWTQGDLADIRRRVDAVWDLAAERGGPWDVGELLWWLHCAGADRAAPRPAAEPFALMVAGDARAAAKAWDAIGNPFWTALARAGSDDPDDLRAAVAGLEALGATATLAAVLRDLRRRALRCPGDPVRPAAPTRPGSPSARWRCSTRCPKASPTRRSRAASSCRRRRWRTTCPRCCASSRSPRVPAPSPPPGRWA